MTIGGGLNASYSASGQGTGSALTDSSGNSVLSSVDSAISGPVGLLDQSGSGGLPWSARRRLSTTRITRWISGQADNLTTGDAVVYSSGGGAPINGLKDGQTYYVITDGPNRIQLAQTHNDALAGTAIPITAAGATGTQHSFSASGTDIGNSARSATGAAVPSGAVSAGTAAPSGTLPSGTTAAITGASVINAASLEVAANQTLTINDTAGGGGAGGAAAVGVGVGVVTIDSNVSAYVGSDVGIQGIGGLGALNVDATRNLSVTVLGVAGAVSGFVSLGSSVAVVTDTSNVIASIGAQITNSGVVQPVNASDGTRVLGAGFASVGVIAANTVTVDETTGAANLSAGAGLGAGITIADIEGQTDAAIGDFATIGSVATPIGSLTVNANRNVTVGPAQGGDFAVALSGGLAVGGAAGYGSVTVGGTVAATVGKNVVVAGTGDVQVQATSNTVVAINLDGAAIGAVAVGAMIANVTVGGVVQASVGQSSDIRGRNVTVNANGTINASATATPGIGRHPLGFRRGGQRHLGPGHLGDGRQQHGDPRHPGRLDHLDREQYGDRHGVGRLLWWRLGRRLGSRHHDHEPQRRDHRHRHRDRRERRVLAVGQLRQHHDGERVRQQRCRSRYRAGDHHRRADGHDRRGGRRRRRERRARRPDHRGRRAQCRSPHGCHAVLATAGRYRRPRRRCAHQRHGHRHGQHEHRDRRMGGAAGRHRQHPGAGHRPQSAVAGRGGCLGARRHHQCIGQSDDQFDGQCHDRRQCAGRRHQRCGHRGTPGGPADLGLCQLVDQRPGRRYQPERQQHADHPHDGDRYPPAPRSMG
ncbi:MAG: hypothetical protein WDO24_04725 [Pseudomonadota bacterium]